MSVPAITALMPVKDVEPSFLDAAIGSMHRQTCPDWRLLIIVESDDHPTLRRARDEAASDARIGVAVNEGRYLAGAFNTGMRQAETAFVAILLADDEWDPDAVSVLARNITLHPRVDFFHSSRVIVNDAGIPISSIHRSVELCGPAHFLHTSPVKHLLCWRRQTGLDVGGMDETLAIGADDYDFPWTMADKGAVFLAIPECLYRYRDHRAGVRLTTHVPLSTQLLQLRDMFKKHGATTTQVFRKLQAARRTYLRQCLYQTPVDKWISERLGKKPGAGWREKYR